MKKILIITNHFMPETFRVNDLALELAAKGNKVKVLTSIPDYPEGHFYKGYSLFQRRVETIKGIEIVRVPVIPRRNGRSIHLIINYLSGIFFFFFYALYQALFHKYDCIFVHDTSPAFISIPALIIHKIRRTPVYHWILDMWPESLVAGGITNATVYSIITGMMKMFYRNDEKIFITSHGFREMLVSRGVPDEKIVYLPNWCDDDVIKDAECDIPKLPEGFRIMFAGNLGIAQDPVKVIQAAHLTAIHSDIHWIFLGDGRMAPWMKEYIRTNHLEDTVHMLGKFPPETMSTFFRQADVMLISLQNNKVFSLTLPAKIQAYMANSKPILGMVNGESALVIDHAQCGWTVNPEEPKALAAKAIEISKLRKDELYQYGQNAYKYYETHFTKELCMKTLEDVLES